MVDNLITYFLNEPRRLKLLSRALVWVGGFVLIAGLSGWAARRMIGVVQRRAPQQLPQTVAELFPALPTWWVPETVLGAIPALLVVVAGFWLSSLARRTQRSI